MTAPHDHAQHQHTGHNRPSAGEPRGGSVSFDKRTPTQGHGGHAGHGGHGWMMIACCIPMLVIAVVLVATGVASPGFIVVALACTAMMALMMRGMNEH